MATIIEFQERVRRAVREELQKCLAEGDLPEGKEGEAQFATIETLALVPYACPLANQRDYYPFIRQMAKFSTAAKLTQAR